MIRRQAALRLLAALWAAFAFLVLAPGLALACACDDGANDNLCKVGETFDPRTGACLDTPVS